MRVAGQAYHVLLTEEIDLIHQGALRILSEMGMQVKTQHLLRVLAGSGLPVCLPSWEGG